MENLEKTYYPVYVVGTGPGDPDLLTVKAKKLIEEADVVLYDCLPATYVTNVATNAEVIFLNKHPDQGEEKVDILPVIERLHREGKKVVRLKAGDAMMFNGGDVEARFFKENGIPFELIPGITAACAASNIFAIPTTEIHKSNAIVHLIAFDIPDNYAHIRQVARLLEFGTTVALYMAYDNLKEIFRVFQEEGVPKNIPVMIASMISLTQEDAAKATMETVFEIIEKRQMVSPFIFFVGQYVDMYAEGKGMKEHLEKFMEQKGK